MYKVFIFGFLIAFCLFLRLFFFDFSLKIIPTGFVVFEGVLKNEPRVNDRGQILVFENVRVYTDFLPKYLVGDRFRIGGNVDEQGRIFEPKIEVLQKRSRSGLFEVVGVIRQYLSDSFAQVLPKKEAILVQGTVLGVDNIDHEFRQQLIKTGTIHVVVVSGQNMAIAAGMFLALAKYLGRRLSVFLALVGVVGYATIAGFEPPVVRAALMVGAATVATLFGREVWPLWSLLLAALVIVFVFPPALLEISFQLTFAASLGIMTLGKQIEKRHRNWLGATIAVAISAYIFTLPLIIFYFGRISLVGPLVNILVTEVVTPIMILGLVLAIASLIWMPVAQVVAYIVYVPAFYFVKAVEFFAAFPFAQIEVEPGSVVVLIFGYALAGLLTAFLTFRKHLWLNRG